MKGASNKKKQQEENPNLPPSAKRRTLQTYQNYLDLFEEVINDVWADQLDNKKANTICVAAGYAMTALKGAGQGKMKLNIFLQDMHKVKVRVEELSQEQMDAFLQGDEDAQVEILQGLAAIGGIQDVEAEIVPRQEKRAKLNVPLISKMTGIPDVKAALNKEGDKPSMKVEKHQWMWDVTGKIRFCATCCTEADAGNSDDACPGDLLKAD
jgi:hypothetical protein